MQVRPSHRRYLRNPIRIAVGEGGQVKSHFGKLECCVVAWGWCRFGTAGCGTWECVEREHIQSFGVRFDPFSLLLSNTVHHFMFKIFAFPVCVCRIRQLNQ